MNDFMKTYKQIQSEEGASIAFLELENFLREITKSLSSEEAFMLCRCLLSIDEMKEYLNNI